MSDLQKLLLTIFRLVIPALMGGLGSSSGQSDTHLQISFVFCHSGSPSFKNIIKYSPASTIHDSRLPPSIMKGGDRMQEITAGAVHAVRKLA